MKNLPDKIYLNFGEITKEEFVESDYKEFCKIDEYAVTYCENKVYDCDVEYVRKDEFIRKVANYLNYVLNDRVEIKTPETIIPSLLTKGEFIEDFKEYMED